MDIRNGNITVGEILRNPAAKQLFQQELPEYMSNPFMMGMARSMSLKAIISLSRGRVPKEKTDRLLERLKLI